MALSILRKNKKITQKMLANALGIKQATVSCYETKRAKPSIETIFKLAEILEVSVETIFNCFVSK